MENMGEWEQKSLVNELKMGKEFARQLQIHLSLPTSSRETREMLAQKILDSYEKSLSLLNLSGPSLQMGEANVSHGGKGVVGMSDSPTSLSGEDSDRDLKDLDTNKDGHRKRKSMPRWTQQVRINPGVGLEGPLQDGHSWRKYGQKDILGAKFPRGYYRCIYRNIQGCLATKQIQRSDEDPTIFDITYRGRHTCNNQGNTSLNNPSVPIETKEPNTTMEPHQPQQQSPFLNLNTQDLDTYQEGSFPSFNFPSATMTMTTTTMTTLLNDNVDQTPVVSSPIFDSSFNIANFFPPGSSSYFGHDHPGGSELSEIFKTISPPTSTTTNSPTVGLGSSYGNVTDFDPNFTFDNPPGFN